MPVVRSSQFESGTVTQLLVPSKVRARPYLPEAVRVAPKIVPVLPCPVMSRTVGPLASSKLNAATGPATVANVAVKVVAAAGAVIEWLAAPASDHAEK
jgi:hypothetical protein